MKRMVTRTIELNTYTVRTMNIETAEVRDIDYTVGTSYKPGDVLKLLRAEHETDTFKLVAVINHTRNTPLRNGRTDIYQQRHYLATSRQI